MNTQGVFGPAGGKTLVACVDDLHMTQKSEYGFNPPLELIRQWSDYGFWWAPVSSSHVHASSVTCSWFVFVAAAFG
jgi:hypothetical protein